MGFAENLKRMRVEKGLSQQELAKRANISQTAIYQYENGARTPKMNTVVRIAKALNVPFSSLFDAGEAWGLSTGNFLEATNLVIDSTKEDFLKAANSVIDSTKEDLLKTANIAADSTTDDFLKATNSVFDSTKDNLLKATNSVFDSTKDNLLKATNSANIHMEHLLENRTQSFGDPAEHSQQKSFIDETESTKINEAIYKLAPDSKLIDSLKQLNREGKKEAARQIELLTKIPEYRTDYKPNNSTDVEHTPEPEAPEQ